MESDFFLQNSEFYHFQDSILSLVHHPLAQVVRLPLLPLCLKRKRKIEIIRIV